MKGVYVLFKISKEDLAETGYPEGVFAKLTLNDYDWVSYTLSANITTEKQGRLDVKFAYYGAVTSEMRVEQKSGEWTKIYKFSFDSEIFKKNIITYMISHVASWAGADAFVPGPFIIDFYNEVLDDYRLVEEPMLLGAEANND